MDGSNPAFGGGCRGECEMNDDKKQSPVAAFVSSRDSLHIPQEVGAVPPYTPSGHHVLNEHVQPYTTLPGCFLTKAQDEKVVEIAQTKKPDIPLHVAPMNLKDSCVYIPLQLVLNHFKDERTKATIQLEVPDYGIYSVGASKHTDDQVVLEAGWDTFVASHHIQEKDLLIFRSMEKGRFEVLILDPSGHEKNPSFPVTGNPSSSTQETSGDSVHSVAPPPREVNELSSSDDTVREGTEECCRAQERVTRSCAKAQKIASTSSPSAKSGPGARKPRDLACVKLEVGSKLLPKNLNGPSQRPYILSLGITLPLQAVNKVEEKVQEIQSELPIFVKVLTMSSVDGTDCRLCIMDFCMEYAEVCLPDKRQTLFLQLEGTKRLWETTYTVRRDNHRKQRSISEGWKEFSRQNGLEVGDICLFKLEDTNTGSLMMTVSLIRRSQIEP